MSWIAERFKYENIAAEIEPAARLRTKDSWLWKVLWVLMTVFSLGLSLLKMSWSTFFKIYATTIGPIQGYPRSFERLGRRLLVHECQHVKQAVFCGYFIPILGWIPGRWGRHFCAWVGLPFMLLGYVVLPFPIGLCYGRYRLELDADIVSWKWALKNKKGYTPKDVRDHATARVDKVAGGAYLWAWPKPLVRRGYKKASERVIAKVGQ